MNCLEVIEIINRMIDTTRHIKLHTELIQIKMSKSKVSN